MNFLYKAKWIIMVLSAILLLAQIANVVRSFLIGKKDIGIILSICLAITISLLWATYIWGWNYTVKALTIGFE